MPEKTKRQLRKYLNPPANLQHESRADPFTENALLAISAMKFVISKYMKSGLLSEEDDAHIAELSLKAFQNHDLEEGKKAFLVRRKPHFKGE